MLLNRFVVCAVGIPLLVSLQAAPTSAFLKDEELPSDSVFDLPMKISQAWSENSEHLAEHRRLQGIFGLCNTVVDMLDGVSPTTVANRDCSCNVFRQQLTCVYEGVVCEGKVLPVVNVEFTLGISSTMRICQDFAEEELETVCVEAEMDRITYDTCREATYGGKPCACSVCDDKIRLDIDCSEYHPLADTNGCQRLFVKDTCLDFIPLGSEEDTVSEESNAAPELESPQPSLEPTASPSQSPSHLPTSQPTIKPTPKPATPGVLEGPTEQPSDMPSDVPSSIPTVALPDTKAQLWAKGDPNLKIYNFARTVQRYSLVMLYFSTTTEESEWKQSDNWLSYEINECQWYSAVSSPCSNEGDLVTLDLADNGLVGTLPSELVWLERLSTLDLSYNQLSGELPTELGRLTRLETLELQQNSFEGTIPSEVCDLITSHGTEVHVDCGTVTCTCGCICS